ncbi:prolipoprotein diacylglyceryl transferase [Gulosibacter macacae]|uniref:Phosphatidylglycerol--prolipoprotein diacylglyceryl transferase n=1 Tax=Gulosibacter macacae TaxID=2488791 RepID=A0A3P3W064_9MICO|nr:prolipoprotein diacylglyceryl transferase [Gulosibacter macacae]RRJ87266.1 prolipoprotein diacylglyceryl transferase [Gulosibacter macacae]
MPLQPAPASIPSPPLEWASFTVGPFTFHAYALIIVAAIIIATWWTNKRMTARGGEPWIVIDIVIPAVLLGLLGARLYHVFTHPADFFYEGAEWWRVFAIWEGGNAIIGALIGGAIGAYFACRFRGVRFLAFADAVAPAILLAQAIGRLGNWFNHELFGWPTNLPWGLEIPATNPAFPAGLPAGTLFHPTFLYELIWNLIGVGLIVLLGRMFRLGRGRTLAIYLIWYGLGRMMIESIRVDYSEIVLGMRSNVLGALIMVLIGIGLMIWSLRQRDTDVSIYTDDHVWSEEDESDRDAATDKSPAPDAEDSVVKEDSVEISQEESDDNEDEEKVPAETETRPAS